tara:strand:- start:52 stop:282 length:231 start_codon:yes stop_codon:yes gene_type:complete
MANKRYVSVKEFSLYTSLAESTLYEWSGTGRIPSIKMGRRVLIDLEDMDKIMASMKRTCNKDEEIVNKIIGDIHGN